MAALEQARADTQQIIELAAGQGVTLRLLGGLAVRLHSPSATHRSLARQYADFDFVMAERRTDRVAAAVAALGYTPNQSFNLLNGDRRLLFYDESGERQIDIFVSSFHMCHTIPIVAERLALEPLTLPLAELLLTKMQIVQLNEKDVRDLCALVLDGTASATATTKPSMTGPQKLHQRPLRAAIGAYGRRSRPTRRRCATLPMPMTWTGRVSES
jgi:hypothetical protein